MSEPQGAAVVVLADSSLTLTALWQGVLGRYLEPLISRLDGRYKQNNGVEVAFILYGPADCRPSPILVKRFFSNLPNARVDLASARKLSMGGSGSGGHEGMAGLEGYAVAIEFFDLLLKQYRDKESSQEKANDQQQPNICLHIIHITANNHDNARHPTWNQAAELDDLSWKSLPDELKKKRHINLNIILLRPLPQWQELFKNVISEPCKPWFAIENAHSVLLAAESSWSAQTPKRPLEQKIETNSDAKRVRTTTGSEQAPSSPVKKEEEAKPANPSEASTSATPAPAIPEISREDFAKLFQTTRDLEQALKQGAQEAKAASLAGRDDEAKKITGELAQKFQIFQKLKVLLEQQKQLRASTNATNAEATQRNREEKKDEVPPRSGEPPPSSSGGPSTAAARPPSTDKPAMADLPAQNRFAQPEQKTPLLPTARPPSSSPAPPNPNLMAAQMQKLLAQQQQAGGRTPVFPNSNNQPTQQAAANNNAGGQQSATLLQKAAQQRWMGTLSWTASDNPVQRKDLTAQVVIVNQSQLDMRTDLWPTGLTLVPSPEPMVPLIDLKNWISKTNPRVCVTFPNPRVPDANQNSENFKSLCTLLEQKGVYALASWNIPSLGQIKPTVLFFPAPRDQLAAVAFPETGILEYPKRSNPGFPTQIPSIPPPAPPPSTSPTKFEFSAGVLANMTQAQKDVYFEKLNAARRIQIQMQQAQMGMNAGGLMTGPPASANLQAWQQQMQNEAMGLSAAGMGAGPSPAGPSFQQQQQQQQQAQQAQSFGFNPMNIPQNFGGMMGGVNPMNPNVQQQFLNPNQNQGQPGNVPGMPNANAFSLDMIQSFMQRSAGGGGGGMNGMK